MLFLELAVRKTKSTQDLDYKRASLNTFQIKARHSSKDPTDIGPNIFGFIQRKLWPAERKPPFLQTICFPLKCNWELYTCLKKFYARFNHFDIEQSIAQTNKNWTPQLIRGMKIFVWCP